MSTSARRDTLLATPGDRARYRRRRLMEAAALAPVLALVLWFLPLLWPLEGDGRVTTSAALLYLFGVWGGVILGTALIARYLHAGAGGHARSVETQQDGGSALADAERAE